jgi:hypothetical protein
VCFGAPTAGNSSSEASEALPASRTHHVTEASFSCNEKVQALLVKMQMQMGRHSIQEHWIHWTEVCTTEIGPKTCRSTSSVRLHKTRMCHTDGQAQAQDSHCDTRTPCCMASRMHLLPRLTGSCAFHVHMAIIMHQWTRTGQRRPKTQHG